MFSSLVQCSYGTLRHTFCLNTLEHSGALFCVPSSLNCSIGLEYNAPEHRFFVFLLIHVAQWLSGYVCSPILQLEWLLYIGDHFRGSSYHIGDRFSSSFNGKMHCGITKHQESLYWESWPEEVEIHWSKP